MTYYHSCICIQTDVVKLKFHFAQHVAGKIQECGLGL